VRSAVPLGVVVVTSAVIAPVIPGTIARRGRRSGARQRGSVVSRRPLPMPTAPTMRTGSTVYGVSVLDCHGRIGDRRLHALSRGTASTRLCRPPTQTGRRCGCIRRRRSMRGSFSSVKELIATITRFIDGWTERYHPFAWTKTANELLDHCRFGQRTSFTRH
jgi:hypothetical protein